MPLLTEPSKIKTDDSFRRKIRRVLTERGCPPERLDAEVEKVMAAGRGLNVDMEGIVAGP